MPANGQPSSTETMRLVFFTELTTVSMSSGRMRAQVDDLRLDALGRQLLGRLQAPCPTMSEKAAMVTSLPGRTILALPIGTMNSGSVRHLEALAVEDLVLEEDHRVGVADRGFQQALGVGRRTRARPPSGPGTCAYQLA